MTTTLTTKSFLFNREPAWYEQRRGSRQQLPERVQSWAYEGGSLTQRLRDYYGSSVAVAILFHKWGIPYLTERKQLESPLQRFCLIREVMLHTNGKPLLLARTIIPEATIKVAHRNLAHLGTRPLGEVIFSYPDLERIVMELVQVPSTAWSSKTRQKAKITESLWGRRTVYAIQGHPLLVSEFFLPEILGH